MRYIHVYLQNLRRAKGDRFISDLYEALKAEHFEQTPLPPDPSRTYQLRPEHDIRSRAPGLYKQQQPTDDTGLFYGRPLRYTVDVRRIQQRRAIQPIEDDSTTS